jgi:molybdenum cofactor cytidylyltransferase
MTESRKRVGGLLLAAGGSSRFGSPKQLAKFQGKTLLRRSAEAIAYSGCSPTVVVLGASVEECKKEIEGLELDVTVNDQWKSGMASSIISGLATVTELEPEVDAVLISLMDQPLITSEHLRQIVLRFEIYNSLVVATEYEGITGVPALFAAPLFAELAKLGGEKGARDLIRGRDDVITVRVDDAAFDVDEEMDLLRRK